MTIGHNNPPDPIDAINAAYEAEREEAENWTDGTAVESDDQMKAVDDLRKAMRQWRIDLEKGQKDATAPMYDAYKTELARWKPTIEDAKRYEACLVASVDGYKRAKAAQQEAERRAAWEAAERARKEAEAVAAQANAADLEAQRAADAARQAAIDAEAEAQRVAREKVKGLRTVTRHEITDMRDVVNWIARNDKAAMAEFATEYVRRHHKTAAIAGVRVWEEKEAF